jgi:hypothetical protein
MAMTAIAKAHEIGIKSSIKGAGSGVKQSLTSLNE